MTSEGFFKSTATNFNLGITFHNKGWSLPLGKIHLNGRSEDMVLQFALPLVWVLGLER
jgi:hypothetical protein